jgi:hypothetical protein
MEAMSDDDPSVRLAAVTNPSATDNVVKHAALDKNERVRNAVVFNEQATSMTKSIEAMGV